MALSERLRRLLAECDVDTYRSSGPGGQAKNKTESSVRLRHRPSGLVRIGTESRSQTRNREAALERLWEALEARRRKPKPRRPTAPTRSSREARLESKRLAGDKKRMRRSRSDD